MGFLILAVGLGLKVWVLISVVDFDFLIEKRFSAALRALLLRGFSR